MTFYQDPGLRFPALLADNSPSFLRRALQRLLTSILCSPFVNAFHCWESVSGCQMAGFGSLNHVNLNKFLHS